MRIQFHKVGNLDTRNLEVHGGMKKIFVEQFDEVSTEAKLK